MKAPVSAAPAPPENVPAVQTANAAAAQIVSAADLGLDVSAAFCYLLLSGRSRGWLGSRET